MAPKGEAYKELHLPEHADIPLQCREVRSGEEEEAPYTYLLEADDREPHQQLTPPSQPPRGRKSTVTMLICLFVLLILGLLSLALDYVEDSTSTSIGTTTIPQYFQTTGESFAGPTATGRTPFLAQNDPVPFGASRSFVANTPLETALPIIGAPQNASIFHLMGQLSPYFPNPSGFGVDEYSLPRGTTITQVHVLHRHGSRYPTTDAAVERFGKALAELVAGGNVNFTGALSFVNPWTYGLGAEILVPVGRQELFDSGVLHYYNYGNLYNTSTKIIARTTTQDRMLKSAEYFMAGFFGLEWTRNATLEPIIEGDLFNNSLAGYDNCNNSNLAVAEGGTNASTQWQNVYLRNATARLQSMSGNFQWNISDTFNAQTLCPYETVAYGYSDWCDLFTYEEWLGFEYSIDLSFAGNNYFQSPTGRAVGIGYVEELLARLNSHLLTTATAQDNITLDNNTVTFPLNQTLYFDFSHDTNIAAVLTALGLKQFAPLLPAQGPIPSNRSLIVSHLQPFGARVDIEIISAPHPVSATRRDNPDEYSDGGPTQYIHFLINQRTLPLGKSFPECGQRTDGWCELPTFLNTQKDSLAKARYDESCNGDYAAVPYGTVTDGVPLS
ncbi:MAG: hypothetical protein Q9163_006392 [Psora crenata]